MSNWWTDDDRLDAVLSDVGASLEVGATSEPMAMPSFEPRQTETETRVRRRARTPWVAAAAALLAVVLALAVTPAGEAIASWFGIGNTTIVVAPDANQQVPGPPPPTDRITDDSTIVDHVQAETALGRRLPEVPDLNVVALATPPEGGVLYLLEDGVTLWVRSNDNDATPIQKQRIAAADIQELPDLGDGGLLLSGGHQLMSPGRVVGADVVVLWTDDGLELRLEGNVAGEELITLARSIDPTQ